METETKALWATTREAMGKTWSIELAADDTTLSKTGSNCGRSQFIDQKITINANMPHETRDETVLHELIHAVNFSLLSDQLDEKTVVRVSAGLFAFLRGFGLWREFPWPDKEYAKVFDPDGHELDQGQKDEP